MEMEKTTGMVSGIVRDIQKWKDPSYCKKVNRSLCLMIITDENKRVG